MQVVHWIVSLLFFLAGACANALELVTEDDPPHNMLRDGRIVGISTDKLKAAFKRIDTEAHIEMMPWARAYQAALKQPGYCVFSTARTAEREMLFQWIGPIAEMDWVLYARSDHPTKIRQLKDVRNEVIGGYSQDVISAWLADHGYHVDTVPNDAINPGKLLAGRFNYWASSRPRASALLKKEGLTKRIVPVLTFGHTDLYLACHRDTPEDLVRQLNAALQRMKEDGTEAKIEAHYASAY